MSESEGPVYVMPFPEGRFSLQEYHQALRLILPEEEAFDLARAIIEPEEPPSGASRMEPTETEGVYHVSGPASGSSISEDTLILLSLLSPDLEARVEAYRAEIQGLFKQFATRAPDEIADNARWNRRRYDLRQSLITAGKLPPADL